MLTSNKNEDSVVSDDTAEKELLPDKCRVCLKDGDIPIFGREDISAEINEFGGIDVVKEDGLPQHICDACHRLLEAAILFRKTAQNSVQLLVDSEYLEESASDLIEDSEDRRVVHELVETEPEPFVKREYIEYANSSESEDDEASSDEDTTTKESTSYTNSECDEGSKDIDLKFLKVNDIEDDAENEAVMIIVSDQEGDNELQKGCEKCNIMFVSVEELDTHNAEKHPVIPKHQRECDVCKKIVNKNDYKSHLREHREKYKQKHDKKYGKVECKICNKKVMKTYYAHHLKMHGSDSERAERVRECPICQKLVTINYLNGHMKRMHPTSSTEKVDNKKCTGMIQCPVCDKKIKKVEFKAHLAKHGGSSKRYVCDQCGKVFKYPSTFKTHCLTHGGELKYKCQFCPYRGLHQALLKIHVRTHTGDYNYKCTHCPARFTTKSNLSKHLARHNGTYKVFCDVCKKGFYTKADLNRHYLNSHTNVRDNICEICGKGFGHKDTLRNHQLKTHKTPKLIDRKGRMPSYLKLENNALKDS